MRLIYETNYDRIQKLLPIKVEMVDSLPEFPVGYRLKSGRYIDLSVNYLAKMTAKGADCIRIALSHYYEQNWDLVPDPDMEIAIYPKLKMVEALTYQDSFGYQCVYPDGINGQAFYPQRKKELNSFLRTWLIRLRKQGFFKSQPEVI